MRTFVFFLICTSFVVGHAQAAAMSVQEMLRTTLEHNEAVAKSRSDVIIAQADVEKTWGQFDLMLDGQASYSEAKSDPDGGILSPQDSDIFSYRLGLSNKLPIGGVAALDFTSSRQSLVFGGVPGFDPTLFSGLTTAYNPELFLSYNQPFLKDFWGRPDRVALEIGDVRVTMARLQLKNTVREQVERVKSAYDLLLLSHQILEIQKVTLQENAEYFNRTKRMRAIGLREEKDLLQTQASLLSARSEIGPAENGVKAAEDNFLSLTGFGPEVLEDMRVRSDLERVKEMPKEWTPALEDKLLAAQPVIQLAEYGMRLSALTKKVADNSALPSLNVFGNYKLNATEGDQGGSLEELFRNQYPTWAVGLNFTVFLPNRAGSGEVKTRVAQQETAEQELAETKKGIRLLIRSAYREAVAAQEELRLKKQARELLEKTLKIQTRHFGQGRTTTRELLLAQADFHGAQLKELNAWQKFLAAINVWDNISGTYDVYYQNLVKE